MTAVETLARSTGSLVIRRQPVAGQRAATLAHH